MQAKTLADYPGMKNLLKSNHKLQVVDEVFLIVALAKSSNHAFYRSKHRFVLRLGNQMENVILI